MSHATVYVYLEDEGTDCWRPVTARQIADNVFVLDPDSDPAALDEHRRFPPGSRVRCCWRKFAEGEGWETVELLEGGA